MIETWKKSIAAGMMIAIGSTIYLSCENKVVGALLFSIGLFVICSFGMFLFTGKIGYVIKNKNNPNCLIIWVGNLIGSTAASALIRIAKPQIHTVAVQLAENKMNLSWPSVIITSLFCGVLMYLAVDNFAKHPHEISGIAGIFLCVSVFILCGFEHSIADMNYLALAIQSVSELPRYLLFLCVVSVCNGLGALGFRQLIKE